MRIDNVTRQTMVADRAILAKTPLTRLVGLLNRAHLEPGEGLILQPGGAIHMFFMRIAIDVIFADKEGTVLKTALNIKPWRMVMAPRHCRYTIELPVGVIESSGTEPGDHLEMTSA